MLLEDIWLLFQREVFPIPSVDARRHPVFNPYNDMDNRIDQPNAIEIRRKNLLNYLKSFTKRPSRLVLGEAPGWRGCRFSGVPFTSEAQLNGGELPFFGSPSSRRDPPFSEATATVFWRVMYPYYSKFLVWNCLPIHPYQVRDRLSNRTPGKGEILSYKKLLVELIALLAPEQIIAVGRSAERLLTYLGISPISVRHPSHGGAKAFEENVAIAFV